MPDFVLSIVTIVRAGLFRFWKKPDMSANTTLLIVKSPAVACRFYQRCHQPELSLKNAVETVNLRIHGNDNYCQENIILKKKL